MMPLTFLLCLLHLTLMSVCCHVNSFQSVSGCLQVYWISPVAFSMRSMAVNEFLTSDWNKPYPANPSQRLGNAVLDSFGIQTEWFWLWLGILVLIGYVLLFNFITVVAFSLLSCKHPSLHC